MSTSQLSSHQVLGCRPFRQAATVRHCRAVRRALCVARPQVARCAAATSENEPQPSRRTTLRNAAAVVAAAMTSRPSAALAESPLDLGAMTSSEGDKLLIDTAAEKDLESKPRITTKSGLEYQEFVAGKGPTPTVGIQVSKPLFHQSGLEFQELVAGKVPTSTVGIQIVVNYVAKTPNGKIFDNSLAKGSPYYVRVGTGAVVPGLDEALLSMQTGSIRRLYIPGDLAFPKGLASAPGRPKVPPKSPVVFDVQLVYIPGISDDLEFE